MCISVRWQKPLPANGHAPLASGCFTVWDCSPPSSSRFSSRASLGRRLQKRSHYRVHQGQFMSEQPQPPISPWDSHNQKLVSNVRPADWKNPLPAPRYNLGVIGGGTAGLVTAAGAAGLGAK